MLIPVTIEIITHKCNDLAIKYKTQKKIKTLIRLPLYNFIQELLECSFLNIKKQIVKESKKNE